MPRMNISIVNPAEWIPKIRDLLNANWAETGFNFPFNPSVEIYGQLYDMGILFAVCAQRDDKVIGYCTMVVNPHAHNPAVVVAASDALFVDPAYRKGTATLRIMSAAEEEAKRRGAKIVSWHCRAGTTFADVLTKRGYEPGDIVVLKEI